MHADYMIFSVVGDSIILLRDYDSHAGVFLMHYAHTHTHTHCNNKRIISDHSKVGGGYVNSENTGRGRVNS